MHAMRTAATLSILFASLASAVDYLPLKEGNQWTYTMSNGMQMTTTIVGFETVSEVRCAIAETSMGFMTSREYLAADAQGIKAYMLQTQGQVIHYDPPLLRIKLPYREGDAWQTLVNQFGATMTVSFRFVGTERVQTPAGTFDCIKVQSSMGWPGQTPVTSITLYADGIGPVRQVMQAAGQELTTTLTSTNVRMASQPPAAPTPHLPATPAAPKADRSATPAPATLALKHPAMEKYQSGDGKVLVYKPSGWTVTEGELFGPGIYAVSVAEPGDQAAVLFMTFPVDATIKDSVALAARCSGTLRRQFPDLKVAGMNSTPDRKRTIAELTLTADGRKGIGHSYFFHSQNVGTVYFLLAQADKWTEFRPTLTEIAANLAYAPQGVAAAVQQSEKLAERSIEGGPSSNPGQDARDTGVPLSPAAMLQRAAQRPGKQVVLQQATLPDQSISLQIPQGWTFRGQRLQFSTTSGEQTASHGMCSVHHTILPTEFPVQGVINVPYQAPPQALETALQFGKLGRNVQVLAEMPAETAVPELAESIQQLRAQGFQVDSRLMHVRFVNVLTGAATRAIFVVQCNAKPITTVWQLSVNGSWAPDSEYDEWLPLFLRMGKTAQVNQQWLQGELRNQAVTQQRLFNNLQKSISESNQAFDGYMDSLRDADRSRDYTSHMWSQTTLGQGSWVAESEGAKVYRTDTWGLEGPEGRIDGQAYNTTNFTGRNPWSGRDMELINTRAEYEKYIANQR